MFPWRVVSLGSVLMLSAFAATPTRAAEAPYLENFDNTPPGGVPANFVETPNSAWTLNSGVYSGSASCFGCTAVSSSSISLTNVAGHNFTVKTSFRVLANGVVDFRLANLALVILADNPDLATGGYSLSWESAAGYDLHNKLFLSGARDEPPIISLPKGERQFTMIMRGVYVDGSLRLTGTMSNGPKKVSVEATLPSPLAGTYFGFRLGATASYPHVSSIGVDYDYFSVSLDPSP